MNNQKKYKLLIVFQAIVIVILSILCVLFATNKSIDVNNDKSNQNVFDNSNQGNELDNDDINNNLGNEIDENIQVNNKYKTITLLKEKETFDYDKLHLEFNGIPINGSDEYFNYLLNIKYDEKNIKSMFFNDKNNYRIWSSNMAANFKIYRVENVYILISFIAKQCFCDEILIFNTSGKILNEFSTAEFSMVDSDITIRMSDNEQCMGDNWEDHVTEYKYKVNDLELIKQ